MIFLFDQDISLYVQRDTIRYRASLNITGEGGSAGQQTLDFIMLLDSDSSIKPRSGNFIKFIGDDGFNRTYFSGIITNVHFNIAGFGETGKNMYQYDISCRDASILLDKKIVNPPGTIGDSSQGSSGIAIKNELLGGNLQQYSTLFLELQTKIGAFPDSVIGKNYGEFMDNIAIAADFRIKIAPNNDYTSTLPFNRDMQIGRITFRQLMDQLAQEAGQVWWIDENFLFHHKLPQNMVNTPANSMFNITDGTNASLKYYGLELHEEFSYLASEVLVVGNYYGIDSGSNLIDGVQRTIEIARTVRSDAGILNAVQRLYPTLGSNSAPASFQGATFKPPKTTFDGQTVFTDTSQSYIDSVRKALGYSSSDKGIGLLTDQIRAPLSYFNNYNDAAGFLDAFGKDYLIKHATPKFFGSTSYLDQIPFLGQSIRVKLDELGIDATCVIAELDIDASQASGNDNINRKYSYRVGFGDYSYDLRFSRQYFNNQFVQIREDRNIKPGIPDVHSYTFTRDDDDKPILLLGLNFPTQNSVIDKKGLQQPVTPAIYIKSFEVQILSNALDSVDASLNPAANWLSYSISTDVPINFNSPQLGNEQFVLQYNEHNNFGFNITNVQDKPTIYFKVRSVSSAGEVSDWTSVYTIDQNKALDTHGNDAPSPYTSPTPANVVSDFTSSIALTFIFSRVTYSTLLAQYGSQALLIDQFDIGTNTETELLYLPQQFLPYARLITQTFNYKETRYTGGGFDPVTGAFLPATIPYTEIINNTGNAPWAALPTGAQITGISLDYVNYLKNPIPLNTVISIGAYSFTSASGNLQNVNKTRARLALFKKGSAGGDTDPDAQYLVVGNLTATVSGFF